MFGDIHPMVRINHLLGGFSGEAVVISDNCDLLLSISGRSKGDCSKKFKNSRERLID